MTTHTLFCLPYAGGSAGTFRGWERELPDWIDVVPIELPGRGHRFTEPPLGELEPLVADLLDHLRPRAHGPYSVFGHSLGALLGYELSCALQREGRPPEHFFPSGAAAPHLPARNQAHVLTDEALWAHIAHLGGTPPEVAANDQMKELLLPVLRADFALAEKYVPRDAATLTCPVTAFAGDADEEAPETDVREWESYTDSEFSVRIHPGDHFFLETDRTNLLRLLASALRPERGAGTARRRGIA
ncbi:thioesterase II family protein [Saccharomonospora piscinae]|uniref:thioesterase II family protein n=1 Tax=Saccharomonospora piscinae TaxID=687388 RepID=UPI00046472B6|nr:thioesterase domain-containing protein [Saccharomonospora piscinae]